MRRFLSPSQPRPFQRFVLAALLTTGVMVWHEQHRSAVLIASKPLETSSLQFSLDKREAPQPDRLTVPADFRSSAPAQQPEILQRLASALRVKL